MPQPRETTSSAQSQFSLVQFTWLPGWLAARETESAISGAPLGFLHWRRQTIALTRCAATQLVLHFCLQCAIYSLPQLQLNALISGVPVIGTLPHTLD